MEKTKINGIKLLLMVFFAITVFLPLVSMLSTATTANWGEIVTSPQFTKGLSNSVLLAITTTLLSVTLASMLAFSLSRTGLKGKSIFIFILTIPMLIPSISHGMGLIVLFGKNGVLTNMLNLSSSIYGFHGVLIGSVLYSFPIAFLMMLDVLKYEDCSPYEAASVLGIPKFRQFFSITLPYLKKPLISICFAVFTLVITDYGVPLIVGGKFSTLPVVMYEEVIGLLNFNKGSVIGLFLLIPALIAFLLDILGGEQGTHSFVTSAARISKNKARDISAGVLCSLVSAAVLLPVIAFCLLSLVQKYPINLTPTLNNITRAFDLGVGKFLINSLLIALFTSLVGVGVAYTTAYFTARLPGKSSRALHLISITSMAVPGIVLGLSYVLVFKGSFIYGTMAILVLVNVSHFFSSPYLMAYNSLNKVNQNLESVGLTLGIGRIHMVKDVIIPQTSSTIIQMISYFFVNSMMTISAVSFLYNMSTMPVSLLITQFEAQMLTECSAVVSLIILIINIIVKLGLTNFYAKRSTSNEYNGA